MNRRTARVTVAALMLVVGLHAGLERRAAAAARVDDAPTKKEPSTSGSDEKSLSSMASALDKASASKADAGA